MSWCVSIEMTGWLGLAAIVRERKMDSGSGMLLLMAKG
jgi:hypothetical protein